SLGSTFIYVTHDQAEAMTMADRIAVMKDGRIQQVGEPLGIYNNPVNMFVAGFFGVPSMNFIQGRLEGEGGSLSFAATILRCGLDGKGTEAGLQGRAVSLGVRPENIRLTQGGGAGSGTVNLIEPLGDETLVHINYGGEATLITKVESTHPIHPGERISFDFKRDQVIFFDAGSQDRIQL
ncbi:MAG: ABC transporter ATP-binding protein, partial [Candidatus Tectomicrobia bacterium]|nr:ABC transporter ATP-binding protein [Candidatus Tectomicrobia bacterium]